MNEQPEKIQTCLSTDTATVETEGEILQRAKVKALGEVNKSPTAENLRNYRAAEQALAEYERRCRAADKPELVEFSSVIEAFRYAVAQGYSRTRQTMDNHIKAGRLPASRTGKIRKVDLERYLDQELGATDTAGISLAVEKQEAEVKKISAMAEHWELKTRQRRGELIERNAVDDLLAQRAGFLRQDLEQFFQLQAVPLINLVGGDPEREQGLIDFALEQLEEWLDRYSKPMNNEGEGEGNDQGQATGGSMA